MTVKNYTQGSGSRWICIATILLVLLFFSLPVSGDEDIQVGNESNGPPPVNGIFADDPVPGNPVIPTQTIAVPETTQAPLNPVNGVVPVEDPENEILNEDPPVPAVTDPVPVISPQNDEPLVGQTQLSGGATEILVQNETVPGEAQVNIGIVNEVPLPANTTTDQPGEPVINSGNYEVINSTVPLPQLPISSLTADIPLNNTGNSPDVPVPGEINNTIQVNEGFSGAGTGLQALVMNGSTSGNNSLPDSVPVCTVNPPWAANLTDPPLNSTNLVPGVVSGEMWEINGTTGPGYYPFELFSYETTSRVGIWIHDVSNVVLDGMGHYLWGEESYAGIEGSIGILVNGEVSNIQIKNFSEISDWGDAIVVESGENITIGDTLNINHNYNSGINISDSTDVTITGNVNVHGNDNYGILVRNSSDIEISNNVDLSSNYKMVGGFPEGDGIRIINSSDITISGPVEVRNSAVGIVVGNSNDVRILGDVFIHDSNYTGLSISSSENIQVGQGLSGHPEIQNGDIGIHLVAVTNARINDTQVLFHDVLGIFTESSGQILLHNTTVKHTGSDQYDSGLKILWATDWHNIVNSSFENSGGNGIEVVDSNRTWIENSVLIFNSRNGVGIGKSDPDRGSNNCSVANSSIYDNHGNGIAALADEGLKVLNNQVYDNDGDGIFLYNQFHAEILDNHIHQNQGAGINCTVNSWENNIINNDIRDNTDGILLHTSGKSNISENYIVDGGTNAQNRGIVLFNGDGNYVSNNEISHQNDLAILINQSDDNRIFHNQIEAVPVGISIQNSNGTIIDDNTLEREYHGSVWISCVQSTFTSIIHNSLNGGDLGLQVDHSNDTRIVDNTFNDISPAIQLETTERTTIQGNTIVNFQTSGIVCHDINSTSISGNTIHSYTHGISLDGTRNTTIYNNNFRNVESIQMTGSNEVLWNVTPVPGPNIVGGPSLGGNYWSTPADNGWSQTNPDTNGDGFTDLSYTLSSGNTDEHPLSIAGEVPLPPPPAPKPPVPEPDNSVPVILVPPDPFVYSAGIVAEGFPGQVCAGSPVPVSVTMRGGGNSTWFPGRVGIGAYNGVSQSSGPAFTPVADGVMVIPGQQYTFQFTITAPSVPGTYTFQYRMQKSDGTWFGDIFSIVVNVVDCSGTKGAIKTTTKGIHVLYKGNQVAGQTTLPRSPGSIAESIQSPGFTKVNNGDPIVYNGGFTQAVPGNVYYSKVNSNISGKTIP